MRLRHLWLAALALMACADGTGPASKSVSLKFCPDVVPVWFAIQNENETWQTVAANGETFTFDASDRVSVAFVRQYPTFTHTEILNVTADELRASTRLQCNATPPLKQLNGSVAGLTGQQIARISMVDLALVDATHTSYTLEDVPAGPRDLVAVRFSSGLPMAGDRVIIKRGLDVPDGGALPLLDFGSTEAKPLTSSSLAIGDLRGWSGYVDTELITAHGTTRSLGTIYFAAGAVAINYPSVPAELLLASDIYSQYVFASSSEGGRTVTHFYRTPGNKVLTLGGMIGEPLVTTIATSPHVRVRATTPAHVDYPDGFRVTFTQYNVLPLRAVSILTTKGFFGATPASWELTIPEFFGAGYQATWGLASSEPYGWFVMAYQGPELNLLVMPPSDGAMSISATRQLH